MSEVRYSYELDGLNYIQVRDITQISIGDHIYYFQFPYYRHAIVIKRARQTLTLIGWSLLSPEIKEYSLKLEIGGCTIHKADYPEGCFETKEVLSRARSRVGEQRYGIIRNFARGFPRWCKTGRGGLTYDDRAAEDRYTRYLEEHGNNGIFHRIARAIEGP